MEQSSLDFKTITVEFADNGVATLTLNRPKMLNAFSYPLMCELKEALTYLGSPGNDEDVRVVVVKGNGKAFSSGLDLTDTSESFSEPVEEHGPDVARKAIEITKYVESCQQTMSAAEECRVPVIVALHGYCFGAAIDFSSACDIRLAAKDAKMSIREVEAGMVSDFGTLQRFDRKVGNSSWFRELSYTGRFFYPEEAKKHGFITNIYETKEELHKAAHELADVIASKSPVAVVGSKASMNFSQDHSVSDGLTHIRMMNSSLLQSEDTVIAAMASLSKQVPKFSKL
ncbi:unnamed protein product [Moneuplotes crassus]|uniref:Uncharacterized protein n=1 Tax=Euplotes crassus TaxID=5936 RepID=A0AAD1XLC5_EUPCR|nr:unnamed protein product [Moneuplotes crassus]CAI2374821.1 unnamed protein product [Moneuplotes crassus]